MQSDGAIRKCECVNAARSYERARAAAIAGSRLILSAQRESPPDLDRVQRLRDEHVVLRDARDAASKCLLGAVLALSPDDIGDFRIKVDGIVYIVSRDAVMFTRVNPAEVAELADDGRPAPACV